jgi:hypothetical protein
MPDGDRARVRFADREAIIYGLFWDCPQRYRKLLLCKLVV